MKEVTALALFSGGLDSILAARLVTTLGIHVVCVKFVTPFFDYELIADQESYKQEVLDKYGLEVILYDLSENYLDLLHNPSHGFGKNFNPCIDCKILMCTRAKELMHEYGASFIISGEVLGQRPMSQRRDTLRVIERDSDNHGLLLRPLSAKLMTPTLAETEGLIEREKLLDFSGRGRSRQIRLAADYGITDFPAPAGGCILADPILSKRIAKIYKDEFAVKSDEITVTDIRLLLVGRQFVLPGEHWLIVGRNEKENNQIEGFAQEGDTLLYMPDRPGPAALLRRKKRPQQGKTVDRTVLENAAGLVVRYGKKVKGKDPGAEVLISCDGTSETIVTVGLADSIFCDWLLKTD